MEGDAIGDGAVEVLIRSETDSITLSQDQGFRSRNSGEFKPTAAAINGEFPVAVGVIDSGDRNAFDCPRIGVGNAIAPGTGDNGGY